MFPVDVPVDNERRWHTSIQTTALSLGSTVHAGISRETLNNQVRLTRAQSTGNHTHPTETMFQ